MLIHSLGIGPRIALASLTASISLIGLTAYEAYAAVFSFTKIADTNTVIPGTQKTFGDFSSAAISGDNIAFLGYGSGELYSLYSYIDGKLEVVANSSTRVPDGSELISYVNNFSIDGQKIAFEGVSEQGHGVYLSLNGLSKIAQQYGGSVPNSNRVFEIVERPSISGDKVVFAERRGSLYLDLYVADETGISSLINKTTPFIPGTSQRFQELQSASISGDKVVFSGTGYPGDRVNGVYLYDQNDQTIRAIADTQTPIPGGQGNFTELRDIFPTISEGNVTFKGVGANGQQGIYANLGNGLEVIADFNTLIPEGFSKFTGFTSPAISGSNVAFYGQSRDDYYFEQGIYTTLGGSLAKVIQTGDILDGKIVDGLGFGIRGLSGNNLVFEARLSEGREYALYLAQANVNIPSVPTPSLIPSIIGMGIAALRHKRQRTLCK